MNRSQANQQPATKADVLDAYRQVVRKVVKAIESMLSVELKTFRQPIKQLLKLVERLHERTTRLDKDIIMTRLKQQELEKRIEFLERRVQSN